MLTPTVLTPADEVSAAEQPGPSAIPIEDFFRPSLLSSPRLNPDGTHYAAIVTTPEDKDILIIGQPGSADFTPLVPQANLDIYTFNWLTNNRLMFNVIEDKRFIHSMYVTDINRISGNYPIQRYSATSLIAIPRENPMRPLVWIRANAHEARGRDAGVFTLDANRHVRMPGEIRDTDFSTYGTVASIHRREPSLSTRTRLPFGYWADPDGNLAYGTAIENGVLTFYRLDGTRWRPTPIDLDTIDVIIAAAESGTVFASAPTEPGQPRRLVRVKVETAEIVETLVEDDFYDLEVGRFHVDPTTGEPVGFHTVRSAPLSIWFHPDYQALQEMFNGHFQGNLVRILNSNHAKTKFLISVFSDRQPTRFYIADLENGSLGLLKGTRPWIDPEQMAPMRIFRYRARDGASIEAYLTLPLGASRENPPPLVVLPHGGPWVRDVWGWQAEVQFLASRGYAVLQPNYRGSPGYTWQFSEQDISDFRKMHEDVTDGVRFVAASGFVDPERIAIMGGSFGGYLAISGVAFEEDLYKCAVSIAGVFDWEQAVAESRLLGRETLRSAFLQRRLDNVLKDPESLERISPLNSVSKIQVPVFVAHGSRDNVARIAQSQRLVRQLETHQIPHKVHFTRGEGHSFQNFENTIHLYQEIETFLQEHL